LRPLIDAREKRPLALGNDVRERSEEGASGGKVEGPSVLLLQVPWASTWTASLLLSFFGFV
jgi:hypothetical protein